MSELSRKQIEFHEIYHRGVTPTDCHGAHCRLAAEVEALEAALAAEKARLRPAMELSFEFGCEAPRGITETEIRKRLDAIERASRKEKP